MTQLVQDRQKEVVSIVSSLPEPLQQRSLTARSPHGSLQARADLGRLTAEALHQRSMPVQGRVHGLQLGASFEEPVDSGDGGVRDLQQVSQEQAKRTPQAYRKTPLLQRAAVLAGDMVAGTRETVAADGGRGHRKPLDTTT